MKEIARLFLTLLIGCFCYTNIAAQTFHGLVQYRNAFQPVQLDCESDTCALQLPHLEGAKTYLVSGNPLSGENWQFTKEIEEWRFQTVYRDQVIRGRLFINGLSQELILYESLSEPEPEEFDSFTGVYRDEDGRNILFYKGNRSVRMISPYSEQTLSLRKIKSDRFWADSGEQLCFEDQKARHFQSLRIINRDGGERRAEYFEAYDIEEVWIPVGLDTLYGKLYLSRSNEPAPACVVLPGGGSAGLANYEYEARFFAAYGLASLVFNKSGEGKSKGPGNFRLQSFEEKTDQYLAVFQYLQNRPEIDPDRVGVHGPSEGARLALMMAIDTPGEVAFVNAVAGPLMTLREGQLYAMGHYHRNLGVKEVDNLSIQQIWNDYYDGILAGSIDTAIIEGANRYRHVNERVFLPPNTTQIPGAPVAEDIENDRVIQQAEKIRCPVLLQYGENDQRVNPYHSIRNFRKAKAPGTSLDIILYPRGNHSMMTPAYQICTGYVHDKVDWLRKIGIL